MPYLWVSDVDVDRLEAASSGCCRRQPHQKGDLRHPIENGQSPRPNLPHFYQVVFWQHVAFMFAIWDSGVIPGAGSVVLRLADAGIR